MKSARVVLLMSSLTLVGVVRAEAQAPPLRSRYVDSTIDSGIRVNLQRSQATIFSEVIEIEESRWLRLHFGETVLSPGSYLRVTSLLDHQQQIIDPQALQAWNHSTAYFNGNAVLLELIAPALSTGDKIEVDMIETQNDAFGTVVGVCGDDNRVASNVDYAGRLMPSGCSAAVYNPNSCLVSAGHCASGSNVIQFRVPAVNVDCNIQHPPIEDQFPVTGSLSSATNLGDDWAVMTTGVNTLNQTIYGRYFTYRPISSANFGSNILIDAIGYGVTEDCSISQTQQRSPGVVGGVAANFIEHNADTSLYNSGSGVFFNNAIIGVATHAGCPTGPSNYAQRMHTSAFVNARNQLCPQPPAPANDNCNTPITIGSSGMVNFNTTWATTDGPNESAGCASNGYTHIEHDLWYQFIATCTGTVTVSACNANYNSKMAAYIGCPTGPGQFIACNDDFCGSASQLSFPVTQWQIIRIRIGGHGGQTGSGTIVVTCTNTPPPCPADTNGDQVVNVSDLLAVIQAWGPCSGCQADINDDNVVNVSDLLAVIQSWGQCPQ